MKKRVLSIVLVASLMIPTMPVMAAEIQDVPVSVVEESKEVVE